MQEKFQSFILPYLLRVAERANCTEGILSISLYGSANYSCYEDILPARKIGDEEPDYDIWIIFKKGYSGIAKSFATDLLGTSFLEVENAHSFILYDKLYWEHKGKKFLLAPIITMENVHHLSLKARGNKTILVPWYRPRKRDREPIVPIRTKNSTWQSFDLKQHYIENLNLWQLMMPVTVPLSGEIALGTFLEGSLTAKFFYGDEQRHSQLMEHLIKWFIKMIHLENFSKAEAAECVYQMMTLSRKAGDNFRKYQIQRLLAWLSA